VRGGIFVMALIKCCECGKEVSDKAKSCIHCGCPIEQEENVEVLNNQNYNIVEEEQDFYNKSNINLTKGEKILIEGNITCIGCILGIIVIGMFTFLILIEPAIIFLSAIIIFITFNTLVLPYLSPKLIITNKRVFGESGALWKKREMDIPLKKLQSVHISNSVINGKVLTISGAGSAWKFSGVENTKEML
jgi:hypothetical protein